MKKSTFHVIFTVLTVVFLIAGLLPQSSASAAPSLSLIVTPNTWNVIGLDSNTPAAGPYRFPVGATVCSLVATTNVSVQFVWDDNTYASNIYLRAGSLSTINFSSIAAGACKYAYFEVEVNRASALYDITRKYHIIATDSTGDATTPLGRELYVEHLISQNRNGVREVLLDGAVIPVGGTMYLQVGATYNIKITGFTATQGYNQFEDFINLPNTVFQINSVSTTYASNNSPYVSSPNNGLYADACRWDNNPSSPTYRSCIGGDAKTGGDPVSTTYNVTILSVSGSESTGTLTTLLYDFSGSSYHYNADAGAVRYYTVIDPTQVTISKSFNPQAYTPPTPDHSALTITLTNPTQGTVTGLNFGDLFPTTPGAMTLFDGTQTGTCVGTVTDYAGGALGANDTGIKVSGVSLAPNSSCTIVVQVKVSTNGDYTNTTDPLHVNVGGVDTNTGKTATSILKVATTPACTTGINLATWTVPTTATQPPDTAGGRPTSGALSATAAALGVASTVNFTIEGSPKWPTGVWSMNKSPLTLVTTTNYFSFTLNTTGYQDISWSFSAGNATNPGSSDRFAIYYLPNGGALTPLGANPYGTIPAVDTLYPFSYNFTGFFPAGNTVFYIFPYNGPGGGNNDKFVIDSIAFTGTQCPAPAPLISKSFRNPGDTADVTAIALNGTSTLRFTIDNTNASVPGSQALNNLSFTDVLPAGLTVTSGTQSVCGGTNNLTRTAPNTIAVTGGTLAANSSCTFNVTVTGAVAGQYNNKTGYLSSTETGPTTRYAEDNLDVVAPPVIAKSFAPSSIRVGDISTLTFTITNPNSTYALAGVAFTDIAGWPAGLTATNGTFNNVCGAGSVLTVSGGNSVALTGGSLAANGSCSFNVAVTGTTAGTKTNTTSTVTATAASGTINLTGNTATTSLNVAALTTSVDLNKQVSTDNTNWYKYVGQAVGGNIYYRFVVYNSGDTNLTTISVADPTLAGGGADPAGCTWATPLAPGATAYCTRGPIAAVAGTHLNTATVTADTASSSSSSAIYATYGLTIIKNVAETYFTAAGNVLHYTFTIQNPVGSATLLGPITVTDDKLGTVACQDLTTVGDLDSFFDPGEQVTCPASGTANYTVVEPSDVTNKQVTNTAHANATDTLGKPVSSGNVSKTVPLAPDLSVTKTNIVSNTVVVGTSYDWTITVTNAASAGPAAFLSGATLLTDNLPSTGATYSGLPAVATNAGGTTGTINCSITANDLTCTAGTNVDIPAGGSFSIVVTVTPTAVGSLVNPRTPGGICRVNPGPAAIAEISTANNDCANTVTVTKASPTISTTPNPLSGVVGTTLNDTATLSGGYSPTGSVTFRLFPPTDPTCSGAASYTETDAAAPYATTTGFAATSAGTWYWTADYAGDANNNAATSPCMAEQVTVNKATPTLTTTALSPVTVGANITDTATLGGGYGTLGGTISFEVYAPGDTTCAAPIAVNPAATVNGTGNYTSATYATTAVGDYRWRAFYSGDGNNNAVSTACNEAGETSTVNKATPTLTTAASGPVTVGANITDTATLNGGYGTLGGTVSFNVYAPGDATCSTPIAVNPAVTVNGTGSYTSATYATTTAGSYRWIASYSGDANNNAVTGVCNDAGETSTVNQATPTVTTTIHAGSDHVTSVTSVTLGTTVHDSAVVTGSVGTPTGTVTFSFFNNGTCTAPAAATSSAFSLSGGSYDATTFTQTPAAPGSYSFHAVYSGDTNYTGGTSACEPLTVSGSASIGLVKTGTLNLGANGRADAGDTITYTFTVTNTGTLTLTNVTVTDPKITVVGGPLASLAPGASDTTTFTGTYTLTQADVDAGTFTNTATATGTPPSGPNVTGPGTDTKALTPAPAITLVKNGTLNDGGDGRADAGDTITYTFTVTNTGNVTLTNVTVTDPLVTVVGGPITLVPGASDTTTFTATYTLTQADIDAGQFENTATATGTPPTGPNVTGPGTHRRALPRVPSIALVKTGTLNLGANGRADAGDTITYTFTVTNTGNVTLTNVTVTDPLVTVIGGPITLAPGASDTTTFTGTYTLTQADVDAGTFTNTATATGTPPSGPNVTGPGTDTKALTPAPAITLVKTGTLNDGGDGRADVGDTITYTFTVTNTGNVTLTNVTVTDPLVTVVGGPITLVPGASDTTTFTATYTLTQADIDAGQFENTATATGTPPTGPNVTGPGTHRRALPRVPSIALVKTGTLNLGANSRADAGDTITYTFTVTNTGNVTLTNVTVTDPLVTVIGGPITLAPGASDTTTFTGTYTLTQADVDAGTFTNTATATGTPPSGPNVTGPGTDTKTLTPAPSISLVKTGTLNLGANARADAGDTITYTFTVTNTGNVTLTNVTVTDPLVAVVGGPITLLPGASDTTTFTGTYTLTQADVDAGTFTNIATATGTPPTGPNVTGPGTDTKTLTPDPAITLVKTGTLNDGGDGRADVGDTITYTFTVTNTGNVTLTNVTVTDPLVTVVGGPITLTPGASDTTTFTATYTLTQADIDSGAFENTATATGTPPSGPLVTGPGRNRRVLAPAPALSIVKSTNGDDANATPGPAIAVGSTVNWTYQVTNTGNVSLTNVAVTDDQGVAVTCPKTTLISAESMTCTATGTAVAGQYSNLGTVTGTPPSGPVVTANDPSHYFGTSAAINLTKTPASQMVVSGSNVSFTLTVTNPGNVALSNVTINDPTCDTLTGPAGDDGDNILQTTETWTYTCTVNNVTANFTNNASVTGTPPTGPNVTANASATVSIVNPAINITKTPATQTIASGGTANFTLTVTNTGDVTLNTISVTDTTCTSGPTLTGGDTNGNSQLETTETWTYSCAVTGQTTNFSNTADVSGRYSTTTVTDSDTANVTVVAILPPAITKAFGADSIPLNGITSLSFTINNPNTLTALTGVAFVDNLPPWMVVASPNGLSGSCGGGTITATPGIGTVSLSGATLAASASCTFSVDVTGTMVAFMSNWTNRVTSTNGGTGNQAGDTLRVVAAPTMSKALVADSLATTINPQATIGEIVTYEVTINVPANANMANTILTDTLGHGLAFVDCESIIASAGITTTAPDGFGALCNFPVVGNVGADPSDAGRIVTYNFGTLANGTGVDGTVVIRYRAVVLDIASVVGGVNLVNDARLVWDGGTLLTSDPALTVVEPNMSILKAPDITTASPGTVITFTLTINYVGTGSPAYDAYVTDLIPTGLTYVPGSFIMVSGQAPVLTAAAPNLRADWTVFNNTGAPTVLQYQATLGNLPGGQSLSNTANTAWSSLPGTVDFANRQSVHNNYSTERYYDPGSTVNVYTANSTATITVAGGATAANLPATGFAPDRVTVLPEQPADSAYRGLGNLWLEVPKLGVQISIVGVPLKNDQWDLTWLGNQAGYLQGTAFPTWSGNSAITAHVYTSDGKPGPFASLSKLGWGDQVIIHAFGQRYIYEVRDTQRVKPDNMSVFRHEELPWVTLITCQGYNQKTGEYQYRVAVHAVLLRVEPDGNTGTNVMK